MDQPGNHFLLRGNQAGAADRMRELLARTVQDHVADQRSAAGALEDISQRLEGLEWLVKETREQMSDAIGQVADALQGQDERIGRLQHGVGQLQQSMEAAAGRFGRLDKAVAELTQCTVQLDKETSAARGRAEVGFGTLAGRIERLDTRIASLDTKLERLDERLDDQYDRVTAIDKELASLGGLGGRLDGLDGRFVEMGAKLEVLCQRVAAAGPGEIHDAVVNAVRSAHDEMTARFGSLEETLLTLAIILLRPPGRRAAPREGTRV
jgi:chromosome segregation ATPase